MSSREIFLERMTSPDVAAALAEGATTVVFACGATEQHGPHLPLLVDAEHGTWLAGEIATRLGNALVAPTIRVGCSDHHMAFAGTLSLRPTTLEALCTDYCVSLSCHGFRRILIVPTHGGNFGPIDEMLPRLDDAVGEEARVEAFTDITALLQLWRRVVDEDSGLGERVGGHADIAETSILLQLYPDLVHTERAAAGHSAGLDRATIARIIEEGFQTVAPNGILGDARGATASMGVRCVEELAEHISSAFRESAQ